MEMADGSQWLIREWETSDMEEAGLQRNTLIRFLHEKETRLQRMCHFLAVAIVLLISVALALLIMTVYGRRVETQPGIQPTMQAIRNLTDTRQEQQLNNFRYPMAMLTVPRVYIDEDYLEWENKSGHAFCHGGFSYANRSLVVPRKGLYRVFLQITYESKEGLECPSDRRLKLNYVVFHFQDAYNRDVSLLSSVDTVSCDMEEWTKSLYTSGLFYLEANSRLHVRSSYPKLIVKTEYQVFFGAEFVPQ